MDDNERIHGGVTSFSGLHSGSYTNHISDRKYDNTGNDTDHHVSVNISNTCAYSSTGRNTG